MADIVRAIPERGREERSRYAAYFDGRVWKVTLADHPTPKTLNGLRSQIAACALRMNVRARIVQRGQDGCVYVQAIKQPATLAAVK